MLLNLSILSHALVIVIFRKDSLKSFKIIDYRINKRKNSINAYNNSSLIKLINKKIHRFNKPAHNHHHFQFTTLFTLKTLIFLVSSLT